jgi:hypothetical protein
VTSDDYLRRVGSALGDLPWQQRQELLAELRGHLADFPADTDLSERLGTPEQYAADLRTAEGRERRRGPVAWLRARRPRNVVATVAAVVLVGLIAAGVAWAQSYSPIGYAGGGILPRGAVRDENGNVETIQFRKGGQFRLGVPIANYGRFGVRVLGLGAISNSANAVVQNPRLMFSYRLRVSPPSKTWDYDHGPYAPFHPFDLQPGEASMIVIDGTFAKTCRPFAPGEATVLEPTGFLFHDGEIPIRFHFVWKTSTALVPPYWGILEIAFPKGCR